MNQLNDNITEEMSVEVGQKFAAIGLFLSILAFSLSITSAWIVKEYAPPSPTIEDLAVEKAANIKEKLVAKVTGKDVPVKEVVEEPEHWTSHLFFIVIFMGLGGIVMAMIGLLNRERGVVILAASLFGMSAIVVQYTLLALGVIVLVVLVGSLLGTLDISI